MMPEKCHNGNQNKSPCYRDAHVGPADMIQLRLCHGLVGSGRPPKQMIESESFGPPKKSDNSGMEEMGFEKTGIQTTFITLCQSQLNWLIEFCG